VKAVIYSRFSTDRQNESSITDQERVCAEYAARQGWQIVERYSDAYISGAAMGNRPGFLRMRADAPLRCLAPDGHDTALPLRRAATAG